MHFKVKTRCKLQTAVCWQLCLNIWYCWAAVQRDLTMGFIKIIIRAFRFSTATSQKKKKGKSKNPVGRQWRVLGVQQTVVVVTGVDGLTVRCLRCPQVLTGCFQPAKRQALGSCRSTESFPPFYFFQLVCGIWSHTPLGGVRRW